MSCAVWSWVHFECSCPFPEFVCLPGSLSIDVAPLRSLEIGVGLAILNLWFCICSVIKELLLFCNLYKN